MGVSVTCTGASKQPDGRILVNFSDGVQKEYPSLAHVYEAIYDLDGDPESARKWLLAKALKADPGLANPASSINGKTCCINVGAQYEITVTS